MGPSVMINETWYKPIVHSPQRGSTALEGHAPLRTVFRVAPAGRLGCKQGIRDLAKSLARLFGRSSGLPRFEGLKAIG
jgi:hypothetical protein